MKNSRSKCVQASFIWHITLTPKKVTYLTIGDIFCQLFNIFITANVLSANSDQSFYYIRINDIGLRVYRAWHVNTCRHRFLLVDRTRSTKLLVISKTMAVIEFVACLFNGALKSKGLKFCAVGRLFCRFFIHT